MLWGMTVINMTAVLRSNSESRQGAELTAADGEDTLSEEHRCLDASFMQVRNKVRAQCVNPSIHLL